MIDSRQLCSFFVEDLFFGIDVEYVQEAVRNMEITHVPLSPGQIFGLINLRSQIITVIDLRRCLDLPERSPEERPVHLILRTADGLVSLLVDEVGTVIEPDQLALESPPGALRKRMRDLVHETYKLPDRLLLVLNVQQLLTAVSGETAPASLSKNHFEESLAGSDLGSDKKAMSENTRTRVFA
jgi:purine-binding chemotaxis protein CheW